jgi:flagellar basal body-associated protein FliL
MTIKDKQKKGLLLILIGCAAIFFLLNNVTDTRTVMPQFDDAINKFSLSLEDHTNLAVAGELYNIDISAENTGSNNGTMYVQCSVLDRKKNTWLYGIQQAAVTLENQHLYLLL